MEETREVITMKELEEIMTFRTGKFDASSVDTYGFSVDMLCTGVHFDREPITDSHWKKQKSLQKKYKRYASNGEYHFIKQPKDMYSREKEKISNDRKSQVVQQSAWFWVYFR